MDALKLADVHELLEAQLSVQVHVERPECFPKIGELFLDPGVDSLQYSLQMQFFLDCVFCFGILKHVIGLIREDLFIDRLGVIPVIICFHRTEVVNVLQRLHLLEAQKVVWIHTPTLWYLLFVVALV